MGGRRTGRCNACRRSRHLLARAGRGRGSQLTAVGGQARVLQQAAVREKEALELEMELKRLSTRIVKPIMVPTYVMRENGGGWRGG